MTAEQLAAAAFTADMCTELLEVARSHRFDHLAYLLDLAAHEAKDLTRRDGGQRQVFGPLPS